MSDVTRWTLLLQVAATLALVGLIWFVQVVHYPLFAKVGSSSFADYEQSHQRRTTLVVAPLMLVEAATAIALLARFGSRRRSFKCPHTTVWQRHSAR